MGAYEAAQARLRNFNRNNRLRGDVYAETHQIIADRVAAGWADPVGPGGLPPVPMVALKIDRVEKDIVEKLAESARVLGFTSTNVILE